MTSLSVKCLHVGTSRGGDKSRPLEAQTSWGGAHPQRQSVEVGILLGACPRNEARSNIHSFRIQLAQNRCSWAEGESFWKNNFVVWRSLVPTCGAGVPCFLSAPVTGFSLS